MSILVSQFNVEGLNMYDCLLVKLCNNDYLNVYSFSCSFVLDLFLIFSVDRIKLENCQD